MIWLPITLFLAFFLLWIAGFLFVTDFSVPVRQRHSYQHILAIFPHADDEAVSCGGFLRLVTRSGVAVTLAILTKGERGTPDATSRSDLKETRTREACAAAKILGISRLIQEDFGDGTLHEKQQELKAYIASLIQQEKPDLLITYDLAGFYGHQDHIACSQIITELRKSRFREVSLWYVTFPKRVLTRARLPAHLAAGPHAREKQALPTHKIFIGINVLPRIATWYVYKSQRASLRKGMRKLLPTWFFLSMMLFEYFAEVNY